METPGQHPGKADFPISKTRRRREEPEVRRAQILDASTRLFRRSGFHATTVDQIAAEADISVGLIYKIFSNKDEIIEAIVLEDVSNQLRPIYSAIEEHPDDLALAVSSGALRLFDWAGDRERTALMLEVATELVRNEKLRMFVESQQVVVHSKLFKKLTSGEQGGLSAQELMERLDIASALATGFLIRQATKSAPPDRGALDILARTLKSIFLS